MRSEPVSSWGPCGAVRVGRKGPEGGVGMDANAFSTRQGRRVEKPGQPSRTRRLRLRARNRGALSFWLLFLWANREKVTRLAAARRKPAAGEPEHADATTEP